MEYKICKRCVMDTTVPNISFDENGICNICTEALNRKKNEIKEGQEGKNEYKRMIEMLKNEGKGKDYDCILGISGGIDSSYLAYMLSKEGLKIKGIHIDAGWNTDVSSKNIEILCNKCNIDLEIIKINEEEMMDLQRSYFLSEVINQDVPQDHAFFAKLYEETAKNKMQYMISGHNWVSESITPIAWGYDAYDSMNIKSIQKRYGKIKLKEYPLLSFYDVKIKYPYIKKIKKIRPLNLIDYNPETALEILKKEIGFLDYGSKHCESAFTRLYQEYIQPEKFGFKKKRAHLSSMIISGKISREDALQEIEQNTYSDEQKENDIQLFINKIGITREKFDEIINNKYARSHLEFDNWSKKVKMFNKIKKVKGN